MPDKDLKTRGNLLARVLVILLSVSLAGAIGFRIYLSLKEYNEYKASVELYSEFIILDDSDFPVFDLSEWVDNIFEATDPPSSGSETKIPEDTAVSGSVTEAPDTRTPEEKYADFLNQLKWLKSSREDFVCWIHISNTSVNYPVVLGADNDYYLTHDIYGRRNSLGSIFADYQNSSLESDRNFVIYGHRANYSVMFNNLGRYFQGSFFENNRYITLYTVEYVYIYEIYAAYKSSMHSNFNQVIFPSGGSFLRHMNFFKDGAEKSRDIELKETDRILTLSTCTNIDQSERYVIQARLVKRAVN